MSRCRLDGVGCWTTRSADGHLLGRPVNRQLHSNPNVPCRLTVPTFVPSAGLYRLISTIQTRGINPAFANKSKPVQSS